MTTVRCSIGFVPSAPLLPSRSRALPASCSSSTLRPRITCAQQSCNHEDVSRRAFSKIILSSATIASLTLSGALSSKAETVSSQLIAYRDLPKGFSILRPSGWNEFEGLEDNYDIKWQDVIQPLEFITVLTSPVTKGKQLSDLGSAEHVGERLAKSRTATLVAAAEKSIDGIPAYIVELKRGESRQLTLLCISKMKLYSVNASSPERRWSKREKILRSAVQSFKPRL